MMTSYLLEPLLFTFGASGNFGDGALVPPSLGLLLRCLRVMAQLLWAGDLGLRVVEELLEGLVVNVLSQDKSIEAGITVPSRL